MDTLPQYKAIFEIVMLIPKGKVCSYGVIAQYAGPGITARVVGRAMSAAHNQEVPAHRVVNSQGRLTGKMHFATATQMQELLEAEGIAVKGDKIVDLEKHFWSPDELI